MSTRRDRSKMKRIVLDIVDKVMELPPPPKIDDIRKDWLAPPPLSAFRHLEPLDFGLHDDQDWWVFNPDDCEADLVWPLRVGMIVNNEGVEGRGLTMTYTQTIPPKMARGYATRFSPKMVRMDHAQTVQGQLWRVASICAWIGKQWVDADAKHRWEGNNIYQSHTPLRDTWQARLATAVALRQRYEWAVSLGLEDNLSIRFATDPTGIKDLWRVRDLPEGRDRRAALMTWVSDHWREERYDPDMEVYVRKHLRGANQFSWSGMVGTVLPSQFDVEKRDRLIAERQRMREAGEDHRLRT